MFEFGIKLVSSTFKLCPVLGSMCVLSMFCTCTYNVFYAFFVDPISWFPYCKNYNASGTGDCLLIDWHLIDGQADVFLLKFSGKHTLFSYYCTFAYNIM